MSEAVAHRVVDKAMDLSVLIACHDLTLAIDAHVVERLALPSDVQGHASALHPIVQVEDTRYAAWNLAEMLGMSSVVDAWALLRIPFRGAELPIALATGTCLAVQPIREAVRLPPKLFMERRGAMRSAFILPKLGTRAARSILGMRLEVLALFTEEELAKSSKALTAENRLARASGGKA